MTINPCQRDNRHCPHGEWWSWWDFFRSEIESGRFACRALSCETSDGDGVSRGVGEAATANAVF